MSALSRLRPVSTSLGMGEVRALPFGSAPLVLAVAVAATAASLLMLRSDGGAPTQALPSFLRSALGPVAQSAPRPKRLAAGEGLWARSGRGDGAEGAA